MSFFNKIIGGLREYYKPDEKTLAVMKREYYNIPIIACVYFNTNLFLFQISAINFIVEMAVFIFHIYIISCSFYSLIDISFTLATYQFQIVCLISFSLVLAVVLQLNRTELDILHGEMMLKFYEYEEDDNEFVENLYSEMKKEKIKLLLGPIFAALGAGNALIAGPILDFSFGTFEYNGTELSGRSWDLPVSLTWYPWIEDAPLVYYIGLILEVMVAYYLVSTLAAGALLLINVSQCYCMHLKYLTHMVANLEARAEAMSIKRKKGLKRNKRFLYDDPDFIRSYKECIKLNYQHHQLLIRWISVFREVTSTPMGMAYFTGAIVIALSLLSMKTSTTLPGTQLSSVFFCLGEVSFMWLLSHLGQQITDLSDDLRFALYSTKWYHCPKSLTKEMTIFQEMAQRPLKLEGFRMVAANNETFGNVMNSAYSYYNLVMAF